MKPSLRAFLLALPFLAAVSCGAAPAILTGKRIILFDGDGFGAWAERDGTTGHWKEVEERAMEVVPGRGDLVSHQEFGDQHVHVEFRLPEMPGQDGQARANSGVYIQGRYEIQILDSHGQPPDVHGCGAIYDIAAPRINACWAPELWQFYDVIFRAPRFDETGKVVRNARITVRQNGVLIHNDLELPRVTPGGLGNQPVAKGPLLLQDHGDPVRFRNVWVEPLEPEEVAPQKAGAGKAVSARTGKRAKKDYGDMAIFRETPAASARKAPTRTAPAARPAPADAHAAPSAAAIPTTPPVHEAPAAAAPPPAPAAGAEPLDLDLPERIEDALDAFDDMASSDLWPGFEDEAETIPVAIFDGTNTWLFHHPHPPAGFRRLEDPSYGAVRFGRYEAMRANTSTDLGGAPTATLLADRSPARSPENLGAILVHEAFHVFQAKHHPGWTADEGALLTYPATDPDLLLLRREETEALRRAVVSEERETASGWARKALALRQERFHALPQAAVDYERGMELKEGLALYLQVKALERDGVPGLNDRGFAAADVRGRAYASGNALALLLDRFRPSWREKLEQGSPLPLGALLAEALRSNYPEAEFSDTDLKAIRARVQADAKALAEKRASAAGAYLAAPGWRIVVRAAAAHPLMPKGFDPLHLEVCDQGRVIHTHWLILGNDAGTLELLDARGLTVPAGEDPLFQGVRVFHRTGLAKEPAVTEEGGVLKVRAEGFKASFRGAHWKKEGRTLTLDLP